ncbi:MAG: CheR family methyltransferase [Syntrophobacteria bacterium]
MSQGKARTAAQGEFSTGEFRRFRDLIARRAGIYFDAAKQEFLRSSLLKRMEVKGLDSFTDYYGLLSSPGGSKEFNDLLNLITIHETYFFRDLAQLMALQRYVIPEILSRKSPPESRLRIWSAGCSTGEEPYTIAMIVAEEMAGANYPLIQIVGTDVSHAALEAARMGVYRARSLRSTPEKYRRRFFSQNGDTYILDESIKQMVEFRCWNLVGEPDPLAEISGWDIIFCRNVTIYFQVEATRRVIHNFYRSLREGGYLFTGFSESLRYLSNEFTTVQMGGVFLYQKQASFPEKNRAQAATPAGRLHPKQHGGDGHSHSAPAHRREKLRQLCTEARELLEAGRPEEAGCLLDPYQDVETMPEDVLLLKAEIALNQGKPDRSAELCRWILRRSSFSVAGHFLLGIVYRTKEDTDRAIEEFRKVVYLKPEHALARFYLGDLYTLAGRVDRARREYANAVRLLGEDPGAFDERFAGGFSSKLLIDTCRSRLRVLNGQRYGADDRQQAEKGRRASGHTEEAREH